MLSHFFMYNANKKVVIALLKPSVLFLQMNSNLSTKPRTHYDTLGVPMSATYNEIKSAYYDLTLKYHPDKNKNESAKQKFHEISDAYDVLSKYESRKRYDRTISIKFGNKLSTKERGVYESDEVLHYPMERIYNFDEWIRKHYTEAFEDNLRSKEEEKIRYTAESDRTLSSVIMIFSLMLSTLLLGAYTRMRQTRNALEYEKK